jgi:Helix-turn-helix domain
LSAPGRAELWAIRDSRTLSAHAKLAWFILWSRQPNAWPSVRTLAADMSVARRTAHKAVHELEQAGLVKVMPRETPAGDADTNLYVLASDSSHNRSDGDRTASNRGRGAGDALPRCRRCTGVVQEVHPKVVTEALQV